MRCREDSARQEGHQEDRHPSQGDNKDVQRRKGRHMGRCMKVQNSILSCITQNGVAFVDHVEAVEVEHLRHEHVGFE